ncbi:probable G-protein coupled receptor Mth-like 1 [Scaptodrosophila lebanonensis]|uniref:Probable G-protein coupled receptor Mth-like 1 n=1 Tax=Drosophila lebanonensis TaxID=7225 RepID=A0A6J2U5A7_DROLE|nr:probable G-protein coupled receptor Mth-like 1 [Scaptodrosophila lebanonensis]
MAAIKHCKKHLLISLLLIFILIKTQLTHSIEFDDVVFAASSTPGPMLTYPTSSGRPQRPSVKLNKCCHFGEYLNATTRTCIAGSSEHWVPLVYLIQRHAYFNPVGGHPSFMEFSPNMRPSIPQQRQQQDEEQGQDLSSCRDQDLELFQDRQAKLVIFGNGSLYVRERAVLIKPLSYCVDRQVALVCFTRSVASTPDQKQREREGVGNVTAPLRLYKCCGKNRNYDSVTKTCSIAAKGNGQLTLTPQLEAGAYQTLYGLPECSKEAYNASYVIAGDWQEAQLNRSSGELHLTHKNLSASQYCLEHTQRDGEVKIIACTQHFSPAINLEVDSDGQTSGARLQKAVLNVGILISVVFLAATLAAGYMMPAVHHALHWRCQIYYVFCLLVGEVLLAIEQLHTALVSGSGWCLLVAVGMQFFFLSAFFWLNTMCFNIWWTFRDFRPSSLERNQEALRLRLYSAYAWGVPLLICTIAACVDQLPDTTLLRPGFAQPYCWFDNRTLAIFAYFYGPIGLLLCANIALFISTTHQLTCGLWKRDDVKSSTEKSALGKVCLKLVVVMGVTWIADIISWIVGGPHEAWLLTDLINALQGVFIFIVVGCQPQVWTACKRICCPRLRHDITNTTNGVQHSSSSQGLPSMAGCGTEFTQNTSMNITSTQCTSSSSPPNSSSNKGVCVSGDFGSSVDNTGVDSSANGSGDSAAALTDSAMITTAKIPMETIC